MDHRYLAVEDGTTLHYLTSGSIGTPIVFVHGWCSNAKHFSEQLSYFAQEHRVIAVDRRGHGQSDAPDHGYSAVQHAQDLAAILDHESIASAIVVGHAGGCPSVLHFAVNHPDRCTALVLLDTRISPAADLRGADSDSPLAQMVEAIADDTAFENIYRGFISPERAELADAIVADALAVPRSIAQADLASIAIDTVSLSRSVRCRVLWISVDPPNEEYLNSVFAQVRCRHIADSGHFVQLEAPDEVNSEIAEFLAALEG